MLSSRSLSHADRLALLREAGLAPSVLRDAAERVEIAAYARLYNRVVERLDDEAFGLLPSPMPRGSFEFLCRSLMGSGTLAQLFQRLPRFLRLVLPGLEVGLVREGRVLLLRIGERDTGLNREDPRRVFAFEWLLRLVHGVACWFAGRAVVLEEVVFPYAAPAHAGDYSRVYTEQARFEPGPELLARMDAGVLDIAVERDHLELERFLAGAPGRISMLHRPEHSIARAVRELLARDLANPPRFEAVAAALAVPPRSLHRRLREEQTSFRRIKDELRRARALDDLGRQQRGIAQTAAALGYSEPSAFFRAFHGWTGEAPSSYRRRHARN